MKGLKGHEHQAIHDRMEFLANLKVVKVSQDQLQGRSTLFEKWEYSGWSILRRGNQINILILGHNSDKLGSCG